MVYKDCVSPKGGRCGFVCMPLRIRARIFLRVDGGGIQVIDKVDAPEENEGSFSSDCKFSCALGSARTENLSGMKIPSRPGKRAFGNFLLGDVHAAACG